MLDLERRHGLRFVAYVIAKVAALAVVLAVQIAIFRTTVELGFMLREAFGGDAPAAIYRRSALVSATCNWLAAVACATIGLIVSACVRSTDKGVLAVPLLITPQILLGATILPIKGGLLKVLAMLFSPLYWAHRGCRSEGSGGAGLLAESRQLRPSIMDSNSRALDADRGGDPRHDPRAAVAGAGSDGPQSRFAIRALQDPDYAVVHARRHHWLTRWRMSSRIRRTATRRSSCVPARAEGSGKPQ